MDIIERLQWRYATKKFDTHKRLPEAKVTTLVEAFNLTATSYGLQPLRLVVIQDKDLQAELVKHSMQQQQIADASHVFVICVERQVKEPFVRDYFDNVKDTRDTPDEILNPFREFLIDKFEEHTPEQTFVWAKNQAYLALGNLLTVCAIEGIDSCPMEGFEPERYDEVLELEKRGLQSVLVLPVGYRANDDMFAEFEKVRRPISETVIHI